MTECKDKCWCKKFPVRESDPDDPPLLQGITHMAHKIEHLYDGIEKCFERIELIDIAISSDGRIEDFVKQNVEKIHERIDKISKRVDKLSQARGDRMPFVCPRCRDLTDCDMCANTGLVWG